MEKCKNNIEYYCAEKNTSELALVNILLKEMEKELYALKCMGNIACFYRIIFYKLTVNVRNDPINK